MGGFARKTLESGHQVTLASWEQYEPASHGEALQERAWNASNSRTGLAFYDSTVNFMRNDWAAHNMPTAHGKLGNDNVLLFFHDKTKTWHSPDALDVAARNVTDYELEDRVRLVHSDLFSGLAGRRYDLIISNPPYVNAESMAALPAEYRHEPEMALASGPDGLDLVRRMLREARSHLNPGGLLIVEIGHNRDDLEAAFPTTPFTWLETAAGNEYVFMLREDELP